MSWLIDYIWDTLEIVDYVNFWLLFNWYFQHAMHEPGLTHCGSACFEKPSLECSSTGTSQSYFHNLKKSHYSNQLKYISHYSFSLYYCHWGVDSVPGRKESAPNENMKWNTQRALRFTEEQNLYCIALTCSVSCFSELNADFLPEVNRSPFALHFHHCPIAALSHRGVVVIWRGVAVHIKEHPLQFLTLYTALNVNILLITELFRIITKMWVLLKSVNMNKVLKQAFTEWTLTPLASSEGSSGKVMILNKEKGGGGGNKKHIM